MLADADDVDDELLLYHPPRILLRMHAACKLVATTAAAA